MMKNHPMFFIPILLLGCGTAITPQDTKTADTKAFDVPLTAPVESKDIPVEKPGTSEPLRRSDKACDAGTNTTTCQTGDFNGDGKEDRIYIAAPGDFSVLNSIYENDELGEGLTSELDFRIPAIVVELGGTTQDQAINLVGAKSLQRLTGDGAKDAQLPPACTASSDKPIILATATSEKIMIALDGKMLSARRC
jgi:hypothetical protein